MEDDGRGAGVGGGGEVAGVKHHGGEVVQGPALSWLWARSHDKAMGAHTTASGHIKRNRGACSCSWDMRRAAMGG
jgi:hypothetical protein